jgi:flagellar basal-body rod protein FlgG
LTETGRDLDVAIVGEGFFQCIDPLTNEMRYSRFGHFNVDANGQLVHWSEGHGCNGSPTFYSRLLEPLIWIREDTEMIQIHGDGMVWAIAFKGKGQQVQPIGQIELAMFDLPDGLQRVDVNLFRETEASGRAMVNSPGIKGRGVLKMRYLENSK